MKISEVREKKKENVEDNIEKGIFFGVVDKVSLGFFNYVATINGAISCVLVRRRRRKQENKFFIFIFVYFFYAFQNCKNTRHVMSM